MVCLAGGIVYQNSPRYCMRMGGGFVTPSNFGQKNIYVMDIFYLLQGKMAAFTARHSNNDFDSCATFIADL
ncbi:conserved hypothetical protein [Coccidioides posadasii str. Silveira]|uniref:Uncharacterized protein n=1 Tax=Coccidioides posadasii (strain RMSCC 757 / Silveira) TaxID=443226 RepID=E9D6E2_COCPS|nr:conserved hypothetical protein [Coccidioides posadasii str. Silveira]